MEFGQVITAMVTPFDEKENIDFAATNTLIEYLIANGTDTILVAGTTGECPTLTAAEQVALCKYVVEVVKGRVPVIAGAGSNSTREAIELTRQAAECGVDAVMQVAPYYNRPSQEGMYQHFKAIAAVTTLPIMLYNVPARTGCNIDADTIIRLAEIENIVCVKEASGDLDVMANIIRNTPDDFLLYSGDDGLTLPVLAIGGAGIVSVSSHIVGNDMQKMISAFRTGQVKEAAQLHQALMPIFKGLFTTPNPTAVKAALNLDGMQVGGVRLPLLPLNEDELGTLEETLKCKHAHIN